MAKKTLLQLVQNILSSMDSDEVNSISDTVESLQVAEIVRETYEYLVATLDIPERRGLFNLESLADINRPNYLKVPDSVRDVKWFKYNNKDVTYLAPDEFLDLVLRNDGGTTVTDASGISYPVVNTKDPQYFTSFDDKDIACESFDQSVDSTLLESKSTAYGSFNREFLFHDDFVADLDDNLFPLLQSEAKATCFIDLKQVSNSKEEQKARTSLVRAQNEFNRTAVRKPADRLPDYGRRR